ncbi:hypothetical protein SAY87_007812 [Trapa incisa]|uniref:Glycosyl transferase family 1 domain-containing protein n=1 Tax=Trapa incisa TaxID=236973 RepID=A0AAN7KFQ9_9MYRT|nr:hypothetical protein SAY87_007812 [Trapa incisa]
MSRVMSSSGEAEGNIEPPNPNQLPPPTSKWKLSLIFFSSSLILVLAISLGLADLFKAHLLRTPLSSNPTAFHRIFGHFIPLGPRWHPDSDGADPSSYASSPCVLWMAPFLSGGGYSSEAWSYVLSLHNHLRIKKTSRFQVGIEQHGDLESLEFWEGLPADVRSLAMTLHRTRCEPNRTIVVCHSEPGAWNPPLFQTLPCPLYGYEDYRYVIGRTMFESDRVGPEHARRCNRMDYVWVPTDFHVRTFVSSGVDPSKVVKVVQPVDVEFFDPEKYEPADLSSLGDLILGQRLSRKEGFVFLSVFKWEFRKGWDLLLSAYLKEFDGSDGVSLWLLTNPYHSDRDFGNRIVEYVKKSDMWVPVKGWAPIYVIDAHIPQSDLPMIYRAADGFVLPSRGEGWGRPIVEAMAMSLPVIATNWSGPTEYLTEENGYPLPVESMAEVVEGPFKGHLWAEPSVGKLRRLMRRLVSDPDEGRNRGKQARRDMIRRFSPEIVAEIVAQEIEKLLQS